MKLLVMSSAVVLVACGASQNAPPQSATTTSSAPSNAKRGELDAPSTAPAASSTAASTSSSPTSSFDIAPAPTTPVSSPPPEAVAEACDGGWICVRVSPTTRKVEKRATKLLGDPHVETTWSKSSDGRTVAFDQFSKGPVELTLRRAPNDKNEVLVKFSKSGAPIVIDKREGTIEDFTHVGAIAAEKDGELLIDIKYLR